MVYLARRDRPGDEHNAVQTKVKSLVNSAKTEKSMLQAWKKAEILWTDALNKVYDRMLSGTFFIGITSF